jgi:hypothetical protein
LCGTERSIGNQINTPVQQVFQLFVHRKEVVVRSLVVIELDVNVHVAIVTGGAVSKGPEHADAPCTQPAELVQMGLNGKQWIHYATGHSLLGCGDLSGNTYAANLSHMARVGKCHSLRPLTMCQKADKSMRLRRCHEPGPKADQSAAKINGWVGSQFHSL